MNCRFIFLLVTLALLPATLVADDYSFDVTAFEPKRFEADFRIDLRPALIRLNHDSRNYRLRALEIGSSHNQFQSSVLAGTTGSLKTGGNSTFLFDGLLTSRRMYGSTVDSQLFNEAHMRFDIDSRLQIGIGKKALKWGKGYAWNPLNFFGRQKDLNDIDLALEGFTMIYSQYSRMFEGPVSNMTMTAAVMPVAHGLNDKFSDRDGVNFAAQLYMLVYDTDVTFCAMNGPDGNNKFGADFSRNLSSNHEIHAELSLELKGDVDYICDTGNIINKVRQGTNFIAGTRYLDHRMITYIFEYLHNDLGFGQSSMQRFYDYTDRALTTGDPAARKLALYYFNSHINRQFTMKDYLYFKVSKPELFGHLYLNGAAFCVHNCADSSSSTSIEVNYTGKTDHIVSLRLTGNRGSTNSEYGQKLNSGKIELRYQVYF